VDPTREQEFHDFVVARRADLVRTAFLLCGDPHEAHDLVQTALVRVHRRWTSIERSDAPEVYARKIVVNLAASWWRGRLRHRWVPLDQVGEPSTATPGDRVEDRAELWQAVMTLPPRTRAVLVLRYFEDLTEAETARQLGCSVGSVKSQASRGLARLREQLGRDVVGATGATPVEVRP
jgi:RNA polymerase sigma-70 factor (sigma-E family)